MAKRDYYTGNYVSDNLARKPVNKVYGNTVRKYNAEPVRREVPEQTPDIERKQRPAAKPEGQRGLAASFGFAYSLLLVAAVAVIFVFLVQYIALNIEASQKAKQISNLQKELSTAIIENDNYEMRINSSIDYDYIFQVATEELGMVYASKSQIITYESNESEYVVQYKDIN